jgi:hypothetical protein
MPTVALKMATVALKMLAAGMLAYLAIEGC